MEGERVGGEIEFVREVAAIQPLRMITELLGIEHPIFQAAMSWASSNAALVVAVSNAGGLGVLAAECGFEPWERDDGEHPNLNVNPDLAYNRWLRASGFAGSWRNFSPSQCDRD